MAESPPVSEAQFRESVKVFQEELQQKAKSTDRFAFMFEPLEQETDEEDEDAEKRLPTLQELRTKKMAYLPKEVNTELDRVQKRIDKEGAPRGYQSTATCGSMYRVLDSELRRASGKFNVLMAVTLAFKDDNYCFVDTDIPEVAKKLVQRLAKLWQTTLAGEVPLDEQSKDGVTFMLRQFQKLLGEMPEPYTFSFEPPAQGTPAKKPRSQEATPAKRPQPQNECLTSEKKKRRGSAPSGDLAAWLHQRDHELKVVQNSAVQVVCQEDGGRKEARAVVVSGAYPLKALGKTIGAAFGLGGVIFDPHPNKGTGPSGMSFAITQPAGAEAEELPLTLKVVQALQGRGDHIKFAACGRSFVCTLDGVVSNKDEMVKNSTHLPRCVGADAKSIGKIKQINTLFMAGRQPGGFLMCSKAEARKATIKEMARPLTVDGVAQRCIDLLNADFVRDPLVL